MNVDLEELSQYIGKANNQISVGHIERSHNCGTARAGCQRLAEDLRSP